MTDEVMNEVRKAMSVAKAAFAINDFFVTPELARLTSGHNPKWVEDAVEDTKRRGYGGGLGFCINSYNHKTEDITIFVGICHCGVVVGVDKDDLVPYIVLAMNLCPAACNARLEYLQDTGFMAAR